MTNKDMASGRAFVPAASDPQAVPPVPASIPDANSLAAEVAHLRRTITYACRRLKALSDRGGNGADGHLWQAHRAIADSLFAESVYPHRDNRKFVSREEYDEIAKIAHARAIDIIFLKNQLREAQGTSAGTAKTEGLGAQPAGPVATPCAQGDPHAPN